MSNTEDTIGWGEAIAKYPNLPISLKAYLEEMNGQDAYNVQTAALSRLPKGQFLRLPKDLILSVFDASVVGTATVRAEISTIQLLQIAALNYEICPSEDDSVKIKFAFLRAMAIKIGWRPDTNEVSYADPNTKALSSRVESLASWMVANPTDLDRLAEIAWVQPFFSRHVFHTSGHHYLTSMAGEYETKYQRLYSAALYSTHPEMLPKNLLYHTALHWIPPKLPTAFFELADTDSNACARVPNSIWVRRRAGPAGTALVCTTAAVIENMRAPGFAEDVEAVYPGAVEAINEAAEEIRKTPEAFHIVHQAYGLMPMSAAKRIILEKGTRAAKKLAAVAQGYINAYAGGSSLSLAKALKKHAEENPFLTKSCEQWFRGYIRGQREVKDLRSILAGKVTITERHLEEA
jgi:hypothetical protein